MFKLVYYFIMLTGDEIKFYLNVFKGLSISDVIGIFNMARTRTLRADDIYIAEGATVRKLGFIKKGLIRGYAIKENGEDVTLLLRWEGQFIASHDAIILQHPSRFIYQALEDTVLLEVDYDKVQELLDNNPKLSAHRNTFILHMLAEALERMETFVLLSPEERYLKLIKDKPDIANRVHDKYLATMLGITPVSLSRIRKRIAKGHKH